jgi:hypothetical protein
LPRVIAPEEQPRTNKNLQIKVIQETHQNKVEEGIGGLNLLSDSSALSHDLEKFQGFQNTSKTSSTITQNSSIKFSKK